MASRAQHRTTIAQTVGEIEHCCLVLRETLATQSGGPLGDRLVPTARQMAMAALEVMHQVGTLLGSDEAYAAVAKRGQAPKLGAP